MGSAEMPDELSSANHIVPFPGNPALTGQTVRLQIDDSTSLTLFGRLLLRD